MKSTEATQYAQMGVAALLPGMQFMLERMQKELDEMRQFLSTMQEAPLMSTTTKKVRLASGWPSDPEERKAEMRRRMQVRADKVAAALGPKSKQHPEHDAWRAKIAKQRKKQWVNKTPAQKKAWLAAMQAGKDKARRAKRKNHGSVRELVEGMNQTERVA